MLVALIPEGCYGHPEKKQIFRSYDPTLEMQEIYKHMEKYIQREQNQFAHDTTLTRQKDFYSIYKYVWASTFDQAIQEREHWRGVTKFINNYIPKQIDTATQQESNINKARKFGRMAYKYVGDIIASNNMSSSDPSAIAMHGTIGGMIAKMCGKYNIQGEVLGEINKAIVAKIYANKKAIGFSDKDVINFSRRLGEYLGKSLGLGEQLGGEIAEMATRWNQTGGHSNGNIITLDDGTRCRYRADGSFEILYDNNDSTTTTGTDGQILNKNTGEDTTGSLVTQSVIAEATATLERQEAQRQAQIEAQQAAEKRKQEIAAQQAQAERDRQARWEAQQEAQRLDEQARWAASQQQLATGFAAPRGPSGPTGPTGPKGPTITSSANNGTSTVINGTLHNSTDWQKSFGVDNSQNKRLGFDMKYLQLPGNTGQKQISGEGKADLASFYKELDKKQSTIAASMGINWQSTNWNQPQNKTLWDKITSQALDLNYDYVAIGRKYVDNIVKWIKDTGQSWEDFGDRLAEGQAVDYAKIMLKSQGVSETDTDYNQKLIEQALQLQQMNKASEEMALSFFGGLKVSSLIKNETNLIRAAEQMGKNMNAQKEANILIARFLDNNTNPGTGSRNLFKDIYYLRGKKGARVFYRMTNKGVEILAKADKSNETEVIKILEKIYK